MRMKSLAALLLLAVCVCDAFAASILGRVISVADGDTVTVLTAEYRQYKVRLSGIDAPEKQQPFGAFARETLARQLFGESVMVEWTKTDRYGRIVGKIEHEGVDINLAQIREGSAWVYREYLRELPAGDRARYLEAEDQARSGRTGLWRDADPEPPWQWRRDLREQRRGG